MSRATELADELDAMAERITRYTNSPGDSLCAESAEEMRRLDRVNAELEKWKAAAKALHFAYTPDEHASPSECFATGPRTGDPIADYIACPGCAAQLAWDAALNTQSGDHL